MCKTRVKHQKYTTYTPAEIVQIWKEIWGNEMQYSNTTSLRDLRLMIMRKWPRQSPKPMSIIVNNSEITGYKWYMKAENEYQIKRNKRK